MLSGKHRGRFMATIKIDPINALTAGGYAASITGICPTNSDCFEGTLKTPARPLKDVRWDLYGRMRDGDHDCNLDMRSNEMHNLRETAIRLGVSDT
jgi:hypothetical protein